MIDFHTHLLYGIDHGVQTREEMIRHLAEYQKNGFDTLVFTPHIYHPTVKSNIGAIRNHFQDAKAEAERMGIRCILGSELYLDSQLEVKSIPINGRYALVEFPPKGEPFRLESKLGQLRDKGLEIIIAHVERYRWLTPDNETFKKLLNFGVILQINVSDIDNGSALPYLKAGYGDIIASDNHGDSTLPKRLRDALDAYPDIWDKMQFLGI